MEIGNYKDLKSVFKKRKKNILLISLLFIVMLVIWIICFIVKYEGKNIFIVLSFQLLIFVIFLILFIIDFKKIIYSEKILNENKEKIDSELNKKNTQSIKGKYLYTESFYIDFENLNVVKFDEIILFYKKTITREPSYKFGTKQYIILITKTGEKLEIINKFLKTYDLIKEKCPKAFVGYTNKNVEEVKKLYKIDI